MTKRSDDSNDGTEVDLAMVTNYPENTDITTETKNINAWDVSLALFDKLSIGALILSDTAEVRKANQNARRILGEDQILNIDHHGKLKIRVVERNYYFTQLLDLKTLLRKEGFYKTLQLNSPSASSMDKTDLALSLEIIKIKNNVDASMTGFVVLIHNVREQRLDLLRSLATNYDLSQAEISVLQYAIQGYSNKRIARARNVSEQTVKAQLKSIYGKTQIASRGELSWLILSGLFGTNTFAGNCIVPSR